jgi:hypothetical protein
MKKNGWLLLLFTLLGLFAGTLLARWLDAVPGLSFLTRPMPVSWHPAADLVFLRFDIEFHLNLTLLGIIGAAIAIWLYRKM